MSNQRGKKRQKQRKPNAPPKAPNLIATCDHTNTIIHPEPWPTGEALEICGTCGSSRLQSEIHDSPWTYIPDLASERRELLAAMHPDADPIPFPNPRITPIQLILADSLATAERYVEFAELRGPWLWPKTVLDLLLITGTQARPISIHRLNSWRKHPEAQLINDFLSELTTTEDSPRGLRIGQVFLFLLIIALIIIVAALAQHFTQP